MSIGAAAGQFGLATHVLRHWETIGLLSPERASGGRRRYGSSDLYRVAGILLAKEAGLALTDIRDILTTADVETRRQITRRHRDELVRRIAEMQAALNLIEGGLTCQLRGRYRVPPLPGPGRRPNGTLMTCCSAWRPPTTLTPTGASWASRPGRRVLAVLGRPVSVVARLVRRL